MFFAEIHVSTTHSDIDPGWLLTIRVKFGTCDGNWDFLGPFWSQIWEHWSTKTTITSIPFLKISWCLPGGIGHLRDGLGRGKDSGICESIFVQFSHKILNTSWFKGNNAYQILKWHSHILNSYFVEKSTQNSCSMFVALLNIKTSREPQLSFCWGKRKSKSVSASDTGPKKCVIIQQTWCADNSPIQLSPWSLLNPVWNPRPQGPPK